MSDNLLNKLTQLKLPAMAGSLIRQRETPQTYEELLTLLADDELLKRKTMVVRKQDYTSSVIFPMSLSTIHSRGRT